MGQQLLVNPLCCAAECQLSQGSQIAGREIVADRAFSGFGQIDFALIEPLDEIIGRKINQFNIVGPVNDAVWHGFAHADAGDLRNHIVEAFDMLDIERGINIDPPCQNFLDILIALGVTAARRIGVGQLIHQNQLRLSFKDRVDVHLIEPMAMIGNFGAVDDFKSIDKRFGFLAPMRLDNADHDINVVSLARAPGHQHFVGFTDAGSCSQKYLQTATRFALRLFKQRIGGGSHIAKAKIVRYQALFPRNKMAAGKPGVRAVPVLTDWF